VTSLADGISQPPADRFDTALLDLDGVVYVGPDAVDGVPKTLTEVRRRGMRTAFVTNNASRTPETVASHLRQLGVEAKPEDVVTSAQAAATLVLGRVGAGAAVLVVGGEGLHAALIERGLRPVASADDAVAVVQGFAPDVDWQALAEGTFAVRRGLPWIAANMDSTVPTPRGIAPGNGALVGVIARTTGVTPVAVAGKPELALHEESVRRTGARNPIVVGDRLDTDIEGANRAGVPSLLVLTGVSRPADLLRAGPELRPTYLAADLGTGLLQPQPGVRADGDRWECGGWSVGVSGADVSVTGAGDRVDGLRAFCVAWWRAGEAVAGVDLGPALAATGW
jgi:glycerol-1-phosphatase